MSVGPVGTLLFVGQQANCFATIGLYHKMRGLVTLGLLLYYCIRYSATYNTRTLLPAACKQLLHRQVYRPSRGC